MGERPAGQGEGAAEDGDDGEDGEDKVQDEHMHQGYEGGEEVGGGG